ncbi:hypothetical protein BTVI_37667 [Pitangus sulphuratus]|nr:hypothetical protein BTVI_37667 [Pitangus sulphuratus]
MWPPWVQSKRKGKPLGQDDGHSSFEVMITVLLKVAVEVLLKFWSSSRSDEWYQKSQKPQIRYAHIQQEIKQRGQKTCRNEQGAPSKSQVEERNLWDVENGQTKWEDYRNIIKVCKDATRKAKAHLELSLTKDIKDNKKVIYKDIGSKRKIRENVGLQLNHMGALMWWIDLG